MLNWEGAFPYLHTAELFGGHASRENPRQKIAPLLKG